MKHSKWTWLLFPVTFTITYEAMTWACWVPLSRAAVIARNGHSFVTYWQGEVFAFTAIRIFAALFVFVFCVVLVQSASRWQPSLLGTLTGLATSVFDRFWFSWANLHLGFFVALFGMPAIAGGIVVLLFLYFDRWRRRDAASA